MQDKRHVTVIDVNLDNIVFNYRTIMDFVRPATVIPVLKGNGYGHGAIALARTLVEEGCRLIALARVEEAAELRRAGIGPEEADLLIMTVPLPEEIDEAVRLDVSMFVPDIARLNYLKKVAAGSGREVRFHLKVDTGMGRMGFMPERAGEVARILRGMTNCRLAGIGTHLCAAGDDSEQNDRQLERFEKFISEVNPPADCLTHIASSSAVARLPKMIKNAVRVGDLIYGFTGLEKTPFEQRPVMKFTTRVIQVKDLPVGWHVGYGSKQWITKLTRTATLSMGTTDGMMGSQVNKGCVLIGGKRCKILATCADSAIVDTTGVASVETGDEVVYIGSQGDDRISAREQAKAAGSGFSELLGKISSRVQRVYLRNGKYAGQTIFGQGDGIAGPDYKVG